MDPRGFRFSLFFLRRPPHKRDHHFVVSEITMQEGTSRDPPGLHFGGFPLQDPAWHIFHLVRWCPPPSRRQRNALLPAPSAFVTFFGPRFFDLIANIQAMSSPPIAFHYQHTFLSCPQRASKRFGSVRLTGYTVREPCRFRHSGAPVPPSEEDPMPGTNHIASVAPHRPAHLLFRQPPLSFFFGDNTPTSPFFRVPRTPPPPRSCPLFCYGNAWKVFGLGVR